MSALGTWNTCQWTSITYSTAYGFLSSFLVSLRMPASCGTKDQMDNVGVGAPFMCEIRKAVKPLSLQPLSPQDVYFSPWFDGGGGKKNPNFPIWIWAGFRDLSACKATCPHAIGAIPGHLPEGGSNNHECPEQLLQVMIFHVQESDLSVLRKAKSVMVKCCLPHM